MQIVQISRNLEFLQVEKCALFLEISHLRSKNFSVVYIILSFAHIEGFIYFSLDR